MAAGDLTALLDSLSPEDFAQMAADLGVELLAAPEGAPEGGLAAAEEEVAEEESPPSSDRPAQDPTPEGMAAYAASAAEDAQAHRDEIEAGQKAAEESEDKANAKRVGKILKEADGLLKDAQKAAEAAQKAAGKDDLGKAAEAAADARVACEEIEKLLAEAKGQEVAEGEEAPESGPAGSATEGMARAPAEAPSAWAAWAAS